MCRPFKKPNGQHITPPMRPAYWGQKENRKKRKGNQARCAGWGQGAREERVFSDKVGIFDFMARPGRKHRGAPQRHTGCKGRTKTALNARPRGAFPQGRIRSARWECWRVAIGGVTCRTFKNRMASACSEERFHPAKCPGWRGGLSAQADAFAGANAEEKVGLLRSK